MIKIKKSLKAKIISGLLLVTVALPMILSPIKAEAHNAFYIQSLINPNNFTYSASVVEDSASIYKDESKHYEAKLGDFTKIKDLGGANGLKSLKDNIRDGSQEIKAGKGSEIMPLTFPAIEVKPKDKNKNVNDATAKDSNRASVIKDILIPSLNDALIFVNNGKAFKSVDELVEMTDKLYNADSNGGKCGDYTVKYWASATGNGDKKNTIDNNESYKSLGITETDHVLITSPKGETRDYVFRIPKGYAKIGDDESAYPLRGDQGKEYDEAYDKDAKYITWSMLAYEAIYSYYGQDISMNNSTEQTSLGSLAKKMVDFLNSSVNSIKDALSLYTMDELVFNQGTRGNQAAYYDGIMPISWEKNVVFYHWIFQAIAWSLMAFAVVKLIAQKNLSTINSSMRVYMINGIKNLLVAGFALTLIFPILSLISKTNYNIVNIFASAAGKTFNQFTSDLVTGGDTLGAVLLSLANLVVMIYMNYVYIVRAITIALLITSAPIFIIAGAMGNSGYGVTISWIKELLANIFIQTFHAFILSFFTTVSFSNRGIETIIVFISLIPLTAMFKSLVFKDSGNTAQRVGEMATKATKDFGVNVAGGLFGKSGNKNNGNGKSGDGDSSNSGESSSSGSDTHTKKKNKVSTSSDSASDSASSGNSSGSDSSSSTGGSGGSAVGSIGAGDTGTLADSVSQSNKSNTTRDFIKKSAKSAMDNKVIQNTAKGTIGVAKVGLKGAVVGGKMVAGAATVGLGVGMMATTGDTDLIGKGAKYMGKTAQKAAIGTGKAVGKKLKDKFNSGSDNSSAQDTTTNNGEGVTNMPHNSSVQDMATDSGEGTTNVPHNSSINEIDTMPQESLDQGEFVGNSEETKVTRPMSYLNEQGIEDVKNSGENTNITYSTQVTKGKDGNYVVDESSIKGKMRGKNSQNVLDYVNAFKDPNSVEAQHYREQGIDNAVVNKKGQAIVSYNKTGKEKLGFEKIRVSGSGENRRIEETKKAGTSLNTNLTVNVPQINEQTRERIQRDIDKNKN